MAFEAGKEQAPSHCPHPGPQHATPLAGTAPRAAGPCCLLLSPAVFAYRAAALGCLLQTPREARCHQSPGRTGATWLAPAFTRAGEGLSGWLEPSHAHGSGCLDSPLTTLPNCLRSPPPPLACQPALVQHLRMLLLLEIR